MNEVNRARYDEFLKDTEKIISLYHPKISDVEINSMAVEITMLLMRYEDKLLSGIIERLEGMTKKDDGATRE